MQKRNPLRLACLIVASALFVFSIAACGSSKTFQDENASESTQVTQPKKEQGSGKETDTTNSSSTNASSRNTSSKSTESTTSNSGSTGSAEGSQGTALGAEVETTTPELSYPAENAEKAIVVSFSNIANLGSIKIDRGEYDSSDIYPYGEGSGEIFTILGSGHCKVIDEGTCQISGLKVEGTFTTDYRAGKKDNFVYILKATVTFDGTNYKVSEFDAQQKPMGDDNAKSQNALYGASIDPDCPLWTISPDLIQ